jgi:hypothetical protein
VIRKLRLLANYVLQQLLHLHAAMWWDTYWKYADTWSTNFVELWELDAVDFVVTKSGFLSEAYRHNCCFCTGVFQYTVVVELCVGNGTSTPVCDTTPTTVG